MFKGKASMRFKSGAYTKYVSILNRIATQPLDVRCNFETASTLLDDIGQFVSQQPGSGQDFQSVEVGPRNRSCPEVKALA
jgi:hypothetical protein